MQYVLNECWQKAGKRKCFHFFNLFGIAFLNMSLMIRLENWQSGCLCVYVCVFSLVKRNITSHCCDVQWKFLLWTCKLVQSLWKTVSSSLKKLKIELQYNPVIFLLGIYLKENENTNLKRYVHPKFTAALFTIAKIQKQPKCPSIPE